MRETIEIRSRAAHPVEVEVGIAGNLPEADMVSVSPIRFVLPRMAARVLTIRLRVGEAIQGGSYDAQMLLSTSTLDGQQLGVPSQTAALLSLTVVPEGGARRH